MGYNGHQSSPYKSCKEFVSFIQPEFYDPRNKPQYNGYIELEIKCITDIHIGSGEAFMPEKSGEFVYATAAFDGKPVIPGSSFKGVVRNIASVASNGCIPRNARLPENIRPIYCKSYQCCIVCDIFGTMSKGSKVMFSDMYSENAGLENRKMNQQFSPKESLKNGIFKGYKLYKTGENNYNMTSKVNVQVVKKGAVFTGRVHFKRLTEEELSLLFFSMGLDKKENEDIHLKIGGFKNEGLGEVEVSAFGFVCSGGMKKTASEIARQYLYDEKMTTANQAGLDMLCNTILAP